MPNAQESRGTGMTREQRNQWRGIESTPIKLTTVHAQHQHVTTDYDEQLEDDTLYPSRMPSSTRRYQQTTNVPPQQHAVVTRPRQQEMRQQDRYDNVNVYIRRRSAPGPAARQQQASPTQAPGPARQPGSEPDGEPETEPLPRTRQRVQKPRFHWLVYLGIGMVAMLLLWMVGTIALNWWNGYQDDLRYGRPRTYQIDAKVGHHDAQTPSHFLALNLNRRVEVIEFPGGDATKEKVYLGPTLIGQESDLDIVTVSFRDVNGDGKPDMIVSVDNAKYAYINDNGAFRPLHADEHITL